MQEEDFESAYLGVSPVRLTLVSFLGEVKVVVVGNGGVGKTSLIRQFCRGHCPIEYKKTIGVDFLEKSQFVKALQEQVKLMLWDTAGQEVFDSMTRAYYRGARAAVLCFSTDDRQSFECIKTWKKKVHKHGGIYGPTLSFMHQVERECGKIPMALVQNKVDLLDQTVVSRQEAEALAEQLGLRFYRICVKQNLYVADGMPFLPFTDQEPLELHVAVFEYLAEMILQRHDDAPLPSTTPAGVLLSGHNAQRQQPKDFYKHVHQRFPESRIIRSSNKVMRDCTIL
ncbi:ras-related protein Rab-23 [Selaginella moellendorffii]|uniref:ras-related protein Rab-23 n=1 Tax=Selaginella moellendorffii TaxID=88036 RepID=UPI000D1C776F|nr:ras-related protein Rab-23 [Selaginella moellendorffii]|eukprot:XP_024541578.1 ras-related protein Rab-23 [Selaginella moellendorffii]